MRLAPQFSLGWNEVVLPTRGRVALCGMVLPAHWGLGPSLVTTQLSVMEPAFVVMNGIAGPRQPLWFELGAANRASPKFDGSGVLRPRETQDRTGQVLAPGGPPQLSCLASFDVLCMEARRMLSEDRSAADVLTGAELQVFAREDNSYLCNELTYAACRVLRDTAIPRVFLHWPSELLPTHIEFGARLALRLVDVELGSSARDRVLGEELSSR